MPKRKFKGPNFSDGYTLKWLSEAKLEAICSLEI
jgi:hypothetical protein